MNITDALCIAKMGWNDETKELYDEAYEIVRKKAHQLNTEHKISKLQEELAKQSIKE